ncbi:carboxymuconolactone decarboxylase family protein [Paenibacillus sp. GD4]|uniref:carboxymuconolactone decarboxylase family protein n=1 Tax=Paenibacillus TaxID=44249 RepID=UPI002542C004|nr:MULTISPECIES: carboxymuconolactone decarboxylase family protein [Paenibacillus]MDQ1909508.1 carboxymuconolactone decarboxylase family protein [Paenibacillus sp. GD4]
MNQAAMHQKVDSYKIGVGHMKELMPAMVNTYHDFTGACFAGGALEEKQKHLIALGISLFANNEVCTYYHVQEALSKGATAQEITEATAVAAAVGSGHTLSQGVTRVQQALDGLATIKQ